jgi:predicted phosphoribosyltransferase
MAFENRRHAAEQLVDKLKQTGINFDVVLTLPRGGVPLGKAVADAFDAPLDLVIPRKIGHPGNKEYAVGAVTEEGDVIWNKDEKEKLDEDELEDIVREERQEAVRRRQTYLNDRPRTNIAERDVLIVDDGIATGLTMRAAIAEVRQQAPRNIYVAAPVAPPDTADDLKDSVDKLIILKKPMLFGAIGQFYKSFDQVTDDEVLEMLKDV